MTKEQLLKKGYPEDWEKRSRECKERDNYICQHCGAKHNSIKQGRVKMYRVVISAAHKDHLLINHNLDNLISLCQGCHYKYDRTDIKFTRGKKLKPVILHSFKELREYSEQNAQQKKNPSAKNPHAQNL